LVFEMVAMVGMATIIVFFCCCSMNISCPWTRKREMGERKWNKWKKERKNKIGGLLCNRSKTLLYLFFSHTSFTFYIPMPSTPHIMIHKYQIQKHENHEMTESSPYFFFVIILTKFHTN
jgi:hypothetical protein